MTAWWQDFFDHTYARLWRSFTPEEHTAREVDGLIALLGIEDGTRVLDAPSGYGRVSRPLAEKGAVVLGVDQSADLVSLAEEERGELPKERLRYRVHDLREPLGEGGFDVALNLFSSLGYGSEAEDLAILRALHAALRPGGRLLVDTMHRDRAVSLQARGQKNAFRLEDGTLFLEEPTFDAVRGRMESSWFWSGPGGSGQRETSIRVYTATELVKLVEAAGFRFLSAHAGCFPVPFEATPPDMGGRLGLLAERPA